MSVLPAGIGASGGVDTGDVGHSLRFRSAASAYLSRTFGAPTDNKKWTWSGWVKRGALPAAAYNLLSGGSGGSNDASLMLDGNGSLWLYYWTGSYVFSLAAAAFSRDPTSHVHLVVSYDSTQAQTGHSASDSRVRFYLNGVQVSSAGTLPSQNYASNQINAAVGHRLGYSVASTYPFDGYLSRVCFVDGQALTPSSFGYQNTEINEWVSKSQSAVKAVVDAGGTNSFMLDFDDATSTTTLGYDKSSKGNNWTLNNFSLTAGTSYDWMLDVPGNSYCTASPVDLGANPGSSALTEANLKSACSAVAGGSSTCGTQALPAGKWYFEFVPTTIGDGLILGITSRTSGSPSSTAVGYVFNGQKNIAGSSTSYGASYAANDVIGVAVDTTANTIEFFKNNTSQGVITNATYVVPGCKPVHWNNSSSGSSTVQHMYGQAPLHASATYHSAAGGYFRYAPPTGFKALCQANLPDPAILNPSSSVAHRFEAGSGIASAIATDRSGWTDWMEWFKRTDTTESWKVRFSDDSSNMMAFDTNGAKAAWSAPSAGTYLGAAFKLGASSGCVSGTYSGDSTSNKNISHSLGKAPTAALVKNESTGSWYVWHTKMTGAAYFTTLNSATPPAQSNTNTPWGTGNWSSTQFMVTNNATNNLNATGSTYRYILFADIDGLLALLGHTGNASTDGAFEYGGHKAQLLIEKDLSATTGFYVWSDKIDTYNVTASYLLLNTNAGTAAATGVDICSNAIKYRSSTIANASNPHMGISYSRTPGKYALAR